MRFPSRFSFVPLIGVVLLLGGCDAVTGTDGGRTRIVLSQAGSASPSFSVATVPGATADRQGDRTAILALVDALEVTITAVQAQPARFVDAPDDDRNWETLTFSTPATVDLLSLPSDEDGIEIVNGDLPPGSYVRLRFLVSEAELTLRAPLTIGRHTFPANEPIPLRIPSAWVKVPGAYFTVTDVEGALIQVVFDPATSLGQLVIGERGQLTLTPVMRGSNWRSDRGWSDADDDHDYYDDDDDD